MQLDHPAFHLGVFGASGNGKTTYALKFITHAQARTVFLFDAEGEFSRKLLVPPARTIYELDQAIASGWVCFDPHTMFPGDMESALEYFSKLTLRASNLMPGRKFFVVDELGRYMSGHAVPKPLKILLQSGRRYGVDGVFMGQQPNELHNTILCQLTEVVCFQLIEENSLKFPRKFGFDIEAVSRLQRFQFICRNKFGAEVKG